MLVRGTGDSVSALGCQWVNRDMRLTWPRVVRNAIKLEFIMEPHCALSLRWTALWVLFLATYGLVNFIE